MKGQNHLSLDCDYMKLHWKLFSYKSFMYCVKKQIKITVKLNKKRHFLPRGYEKIVHVLVDLYIK